MTPKQRKQVYDKYAGRCAYCGREIAFDDFQVDHIHRARHHIDFLTSKKIGKREIIKVFGEEDYEKYNGIHNLNPSCKGCNHYKGKWELEFYRELMIKLHKKMEENYLIKRGLEYGIVNITPFEGKFYFEKIKEQK